MTARVRLDKVMLSAVIGDGLDEHTSGVGDAELFVLSLRLADYICAHQDDFATARDEP